MCEGQFQVESEVCCACVYVKMHAGLHVCSMCVHMIRVYHNCQLDLRVPIFK